MKSTDLKNKTAADLGKLIAEKREALRVFRFGAAGARSKNVHEGHVIRKDIARIMTALTAQIASGKKA